MLMIGDSESVRSIPVVFDCGGQTLVGIIEEPSEPSKRALLIIVGGPQYRVGSHRQFVLLARYLAGKGVTVMRFDHRGIGDSEGSTTFEALDDDIAAAIGQLYATCPYLKEVALWGLCDAASAALMYIHKDERVTGVVALNPWVRSDRTLAQSYLSDYYLGRLTTRSFWFDLISGRIRIIKSVRDLLREVCVASSRSEQRGLDDDNKTLVDEPFQERMRYGFHAFTGHTLFIFSGNDLTAKEFRYYSGQDRRWRRLLARETVSIQDFVEADHTFSRAIWRDRVADWTVDWLLSYPARNRDATS